MNGRNIYYKVSGYVNPIVVKNILENHIKVVNKKELPGLDENKYLKILRITEEAGKITILYKAILSIGRSYEPGEYIYIDYFDKYGNPITGEKTKAEWGLAKDEIRTVKFVKYPEAKSYRVWLYKGN